MINRPPHEGVTDRPVYSWFTNRSGGTTKRAPQTSPSPAPSEVLIEGVERIRQGADLPVTVGPGEGPLMRRSLKREDRPVPEQDDGEFRAELRRTGFSCVVRVS